MKRVFLFLLSTCVTAVFAQPCTDIFFSEYIEGSSNNKALEIFNPSPLPINLTGYKVQLYSNGASMPTSTLNLSGTIAPNDVYVIVNSQASAVIKAARDTTANGVTNFNGNDAVALVKGTANIDIIGIIGDTSIPNGSGWTIPGTGGLTTANQTLVRKGQIHEGTTDWTVSSTQWAVLPVDTSFLGFHNTGSCPVPSDTTIEFSLASNNVAESAGTYDLTLSMLQPASSDKTVDIVLIAGDSADIGNFTTQTVTIPSGALTATLTVNITNDTITEGDELFVFQLVNPSTGLELDSDSLFTLTVLDDDTIPSVIPYYQIADVTGTDSLGVLDSIGVWCKLGGVVYGVNLRSSGLQFTINDRTDGIMVFSSSDNFGYTVQEGDSVMVTGQIAQFNGLAQINADSVYPAGSSSLKSPVLTTALNESTESELVRINDVWLADTSQWDNSSASGFSVDITNGSQTFVMRIDEQVELFNAPAPTSSFDVIGIGGQYDTSSPFDEGYQIAPRYEADMILHVGIARHDAIDNLMIYPNPGKETFYVWNGFPFNGKANLKVINLSGKIVHHAKAEVLNGRVVVDIRNAQPGIYFVEVLTTATHARGKLVIAE